MRHRESVQTNDPEIAVSVVTVLELAHGIVRANTPQNVVLGAEVSR